MSVNAAVGISIARERFYVWMAAICVLIAFGLFAPTYWLQIADGSFTGSPLLHLHGFLFSAWTLFFLSQTMLASGKRFDAHRSWGIFGAALASAMLFSGFATAIAAMTAGIEGGHEVQARAFAIVPVSGIVLFAGLVAVAIAKVKRPETHKRLMLLGTISILQAPLDRIFFMMQAGLAPGLRPGSFPPPPPQVTIPSGLITLALVLAAMAYDWRTRGRPHPVYVVGGAIVAATMFLRIPLSESTAWQETAGFLARFAG